MPGFKDLGVVFEQRTTDPVVPASDRVVVYQLNDGSTNVLFPNGDKKRLDNTLVEAAIAAISGNLGTVYHGVVDCIVNQLTYTITHPSINVLTDVPVASLIVPMSGSTLAVHGIFNRTATSFDVVLSDEPDSTDFKISWMLVSSSGFVLTNDSQYVHKTGNESISGYKTFENDLTINGKLTVTGLIDPTGLELVPQATNPGIVAENTLWLNSADSNKLYIGTQAVGTSGGGGGGGFDPNAVSITGNQTIDGSKTFLQYTQFDGGLVSQTDANFNSDVQFSNGSVVFNNGGAVYFRSETAFSDQADVQFEKPFTTYGTKTTPSVSGTFGSTSNLVWVNQDDNKLYYQNAIISSGGIGNWVVGSTTVDSTDIGTPTEVNIDAGLTTSHDISLQGYGLVNTPTNMQNGQAINILMTQDLAPYDWDIQYSSSIEFPLGIPVVPSSGSESTTIITLLKVRNRYFATGLVEFL
jgi:hypothetical protein